MLLLITSITTTCIRLLTGHAFAGEYSAHFRPHSLDPHQCQCNNPSKGSPHHRSIPGIRRTQETIPPASLRHALDLGHLWYEGRGLRLRVRYLPNYMPGMHKTKASGAPTGGGGLTTEGPTNMSPKIITQTQHT